MRCTMHIKEHQPAAAPAHLLQRLVGNMTTVTAELREYCLSLLAIHWYSTVYWFTSFYKILFPQLPFDCRGRCQLIQHGRQLLRRQQVASLNPRCPQLLQHALALLLLGRSAAGLLLLLYYTRIYQAR